LERWAPFLSVAPRRSPCLLSESLYIHTSTRTHPIHLVAVVVDAVVLQIILLIVQVLFVSDLDYLVWSDFGITTQA
jgi:hypothetical protein